MKKLYAVILFFIGMILTVNGQVSFQKTYGKLGGDTTYESGTDVVLTSDGGYAILGYNPLGVCILKTDVNGDTLWTATYTCASGFLEGSSIRQTTDGGFIILGRRLDMVGTEQVLMMKTNSTGTILWSKLYGGVYAVVPANVEQTTDSGYIFAGYALDGNVDASIYVVKLDSQGNVQWSSTYGDAQWNSARHIEQTSDGGYIIAGVYQNAVSNLSHVLLVKISSTGTLTWVKKFSGTVEDYPNCVKQTIDGGYIVAGYTNSFNAVGQGFLMKTNASGTAQWVKTYLSVEGLIVDQLPSGDYIFTGTSYAGAALLKTDTAGNTLWAKSYGAPLSSFSRSYSFKPTTDGGFVFCGDINLPADTGSIYLVKTDSIGTGICFVTPQNFSNAAVNFATMNPVFSFSTLDITSAISIQEIWYEMNVTDLCLSGVNEGNPSENNFAIYPNPSSGIFTLNFQTNKGEFSICNTLGEIVYQSQISAPSIEIDLRDKPNGIYFIHVKTEKESFTQKIMIAK